MVNTAIVGLGRLGKSHAINLLSTPHCNLIAACSPIQEELQWAKENLGQSITLYESYEDILQDSSIDAVCLITPSHLHAQQSIDALRASKHVFCEKPLSTDLASCQKATDVIKTYSDKYVYMLGFVRRFDPSYMAAKQAIEEGVIGTPFMVRSQTADSADFAPFQIEFTPTSGGIFHDMNVHDVDLARWFLQDEIITAHAVGGSYTFKEFEKINDADNTTVTCTCENGSIAVISASRTSTSGHDTRTEIYGTKGILQVGYNGTNTDVTIQDTHGRRHTCVHTFYDRFEQAFKEEMRTFIDCIKHNKPSPISITDALKATQAVTLFKESFEQKRTMTLKDIQ